MKSLKMANLKHWRAKNSNANKQFTEMTGYEYILETRNYFIERMQREQIIALIYHELRHIGQDGDMVKPRYRRLE